MATKKNLLSFLNRLSGYKAAVLFADSTYFFQEGFRLLYTSKLSVLEHPLFARILAVV